MGNSSKAADNAYKAQGCCIDRHQQMFVADPALLFSISMQYCKPSTRLCSQNDEPVVIYIELVILCSQTAWQAHWQVEQNKLYHSNFADTTVESIRNAMDVIIPDYTSSLTMVCGMPIRPKPRFSNAADTRKMHRVTLAWIALPSKQETTACYVQLGSLHHKHPT